MFYDYIYALYMGTILYVLFLIISNINIKNRRLKRSQESQIRLYFAMMRPFHLSIVKTNLMFYDCDQNAQISSAGMLVYHLHYS